MIYIPFATLLHPHTLHSVWNTFQKIHAISSNVHLEIIVNCTFDRGQNVSYHHLCQEIRKKILKQIMTYNSNKRFHFFIMLVASNMNEF